MPQTEASTLFFNGPVPQAGGYAPTRECQVPRAKGLALAAHSLRSRISVDCLYQDGDILWRRELADAMAKVKNMGRA